MWFRSRPGRSVIWKSALTSRGGKIRSLVPERGQAVDKVPSFRFRDVGAPATASFRTEILLISRYRDVLSARCGHQRAFFNTQDWPYSDTWLEGALEGP